MAQRGARLEYFVASVFQGQGYWVRRGVPLKYGISGQDATDIDVLGIRFTQPFQPHLIICDCKDKQRSKPYERIFWAKGLAHFVNASETYVALPKASLDVITFAKTGQVRILTQEILESSYLQLYNVDNRPYGIANSGFFEPFEQQISRLLKNNRAANEVLVEIKSLFLVKDPYVALNLAMDRLMICIEEMKKTEGKDSFALWRYIAAEIIVLVSLLLLYIASDSMGLSKTEREKHIISKLTYGEMSQQKAEGIFRSFKDLTYETIRSIAPDVSQESLQPFDIGKIEPPHYAPDIVGLVERAILSPTIYHELPQVIDFLLFEQSLQDRGFVKEQYQRVFSTPNQDERLKVARNIFSFLRDTLGLNLGAFWPRQEGNLPK